MTNVSQVVFSRQSITKKGGSPMKYRGLIFFLVALALTGSACAKTIRILAPVPTSTPVVEPAIEVALLPILSLRLDQLLIPELLKEPVIFFFEVPTGCNFTKSIEEARLALESIPVSVGKKTYRYVERRAGSNVVFKDSEKTIALALMDIQTCVIQTTTITKRGSDLYARDGYVIEAVRRSNGIQWNNWATEFHVSAPPNQLVILLKYPYTRNVVIPLYYTPYSKELHTPELVQGGQAHLSTLGSEVIQDLRERGVQSLAVPGVLIVDVAALRPEYVTRLAPIEHMDLTEFLLDPAWTTERIHVVIGANLGRTATYTCSKASACGLMQFTEGTYKFMRQKYPTAGLIANFEDGARDQHNAMKAAFVLHDYNASRLVAAFGSQILADPYLEEYLVAAYNTGVGRVITVISLAKKKNITDWTDARGTKKKSKLLPETEGYIAKLRFLRDMWQQPLAQIDE